MAEDPHQVVSEEELARKLHQLLILDGHNEVEIIHPIEGTVIVTAESYKEICKALEDVRDLSPAKRLAAKKAFERKQQFRLVRALNKAEFRRVDITDDESFGLDVDGKEIDMDGMYFLPVANYLKGVEYSDDEVGAFVAYNENHATKAPIRILHRSDCILSEAMQQLADMATEEEAQAILDHLERPEKLN